MPLKKIHEFINGKDFPDLGLLVLRLGFGGTMFFGHGLGKLWNFSEAATRFPDPIGLGSGMSLALATFAEFFCALAIMLGWLTRYASIPFTATMVVAAFIQHAPDPFAQKEKAILYLLAGLTIFLTGPGKFSLDRK